MWSRAVACACAAVCWLALVCAYPNPLELYEGDVCKRERGVNWICKKIRECVKAQEDLKKGKRPETCNFFGTEPIVCCEPSSQKIPTNPRPTQTYPRPTQTKPRPTHTKPRPTQTYPRPPQGKGSRSKQMCKKYGEAVFFKLPSPIGEGFTSIDTCALVEPLITNGTNSEPREYPHMALIGYGNRNNIKWLCGGSLISERFVLSAAHCTLTGADRARWVRLGDYNFRSTKDDEANDARSVEFEIIERINHPQYDTKNNYNDIALYRLDRNVEFNEYVRPTCIHTDYQIPKRYGIVTGWGRVEWGGRQSDILQKANVTFIPWRQCSDALKSVQNLERGIRDESMLCAGDFLNGKDTCQGDSGGPLQYRLSEPYCTYSQVGITSFGIRCGSNYPGIYTRVSHFVDWIESVVWP